MIDGWLMGWDRPEAFAPITFLGTIFLAERDVLGCPGGGNGAVFLMIAD